MLNIRMPKTAFQKSNAKKDVNMIYQVTNTEKVMKYFILKKKKIEKWICYSAHASSLKQINFKMECLSSF